MSKNSPNLRVIDGGGEPPDMEQRLRHLEQDMVSVKATLGHIQGTLNTSVATKADLFELKGELKSEVRDLRAEMHSLMRQQIMWNVGSIIAVAGVVFAILRLTGSN
jgi:hypothetical protein